MIAPGAVSIGRMAAALPTSWASRALICCGPNNFSHIEHFDHVKVVSAVNHAAIFPACRAVVHHGGAGTTAAGIRAGIPTLILWLWLNQPIWAAAVEQLKVGQWTALLGHHPGLTSCGPGVHPRAAIRHSSPSGRRQDDRAPRKHAERFVTALSEAFLAVFDHPAPVVAAINGHAIAGGCVFAMCADVRLMSAGTIGLTELAVGVPFPVAALEICRFAMGPSVTRAALQANTIDAGHRVGPRMDRRGYPAMTT